MKSMTARSHMPLLQQFRLQRMRITCTASCSSIALSHGADRRCYASCSTDLFPPPSFLDSPPPPQDTMAAVDLVTGHESFTRAFARAAADSLQKGGGSTTSSQRSAALSAWTEYLVGLRDVSPGNAVEAACDSSSVSKGDSTSSVGLSTANDFAAAQDMFLHHIFDDVKDAALYATTRRPETFLRPEKVANDGDVEGGYQWRLMPLSAALREMEAALQDMLLRELQCRARGESTEFSVKPVVVFWRSMLEQAFISQYCDFAAMSDSVVESCNAPPCELQHLYPFDYSRQPKGLRRRLERGMRSLLCSSAYTLHIHWEQYMARHHPSDKGAHILGIEFFMLWWWANPDQMPVELSLAAGRLPPPTLRWLRYRQSLTGAVSPVRDADGRQTGPYIRQAVSESAELLSVEVHLRSYLAHLQGAGTTDLCTDAQPVQEGMQQPRRHTILRSGGLLCPSAIFPPAYLDSLRSHLASVRQRKNQITCPLLPRVLEVALAVATSDPAALRDNGVSSSPSQSKHCTPSGAAARRGIEVALQLCREWLWPVVCSRSPPLAAMSAAQPLHRSGETIVAHAMPLVTPRERVEDWAVLTAAVVAVSQMRGHLLALRRASALHIRAGSGRAHSAILSGVGGSGTEESSKVMSEQGMSLTHVRERFYIPLMQILLMDPADRLARHGESLLDFSSATAPEDIPGWVALVFARVSACFEEAGMLQRDIALQPASPARLWCLLFHSMCDTFPNVFHSGNTVTVLWTLLALEGVCAGPSLYYSTYRATSVGKTETMKAWLGTLATASAPEAIVADLPQLATDPSWADEGGVAQVGALCPRTERCQRTAFCISTAETLASADSDNAGNGTSAAHPATSRQSRGRGRLRSLPSFASALSPTLPLYLSSPATLAQAKAHVATCAEISGEVVTVSIEVFRRYATLWLLVPREETISIRSITSVASFGEVQHNNNCGGALEDAGVLRSQGHPSLMVLLRLLQVVALSGDGANIASSGGPGLVSSVVDDVSSVCHPVVAVYLRKLRVCAAAMSGRSGALDLLHHDAHQKALDSLPPSLGRQRLLQALLWSGLPVSALEKVVGTETAMYGSGSLAWGLLQRNQQRFLAFTPESTSAHASLNKTEDGDHKWSSSTAHVASTTCNSAGDDTNSFADVTCCLDAVLRHLWQLSISIPDVARVALCLHPHVGHHMAGHGDANTTASTGEAVVGEPGEDLTLVDSFEKDGGADSELDSALMDGEEVKSFTVPVAAFDEGAFDALEDGSGATLETAADDSLDAEVETICSPVDWEPSALDVGEGFDDGVSAAEDLDASPVSVSLWDSRATVGSSDVRDARQREVDKVPEDGGGEDSITAHCDASQDAGNGSDSAHPFEHRGLALALLPATPAAQHIFYSLLELLSWTAMPQASSTDTPTALAQLCPLGHAQFPGVLSRFWLERLALNYGMCVSVWQAHCNLLKASGETVSGAVVLCLPQITERIILISLQSCPDIYFVGLLLLALVGCTEDVEHMSSKAVNAFVRRVRRACSLLPWSVESSLAQFLFHAGVTAASVRRWRVAHGSAYDKVSHHSSEVAGSTVLQCVAHHRRLIQRVNKDAHTLDSGDNRSDGDLHIKRDLLLSMGSLLLCSLEQRGEAGSPRRALYRYNAYVNEFLLHRMPSSESSGSSTSSPQSPETLLTPLRVVLPSLQLISSSPSSIPPQQVVSLRVAWRRHVGSTEKKILRTRFQNRDSCATSSATASGIRDVPSAATKADEPKECDKYAAAFL